MMTSNVGFESKDALKKKKSLFLLVTKFTSCRMALGLYFCVANSFGNDFYDFKLTCFEGSFPVALVTLHTVSTFYLSV